MGDAACLSGDSGLGGPGCWLPQVKMQGLASAAGALGGHCPLSSLYPESAWSAHADFEGHTLPTWYKDTGMQPSHFFPLTTTPPFGVETVVLTSPLRSSILVMSTTSRIDPNGGMLSKPASFLKIEWRSFLKSMGKA